MTIEELIELKKELSETTNDSNILRLLSRDEDYQVRYNISKNPSTPGDILRDLSKDKNEYIRCSVARNPSTPEDVLAFLYVNEHFFNSEVFENNLDKKQNFLRELSYYEDVDIRCQVSSEPIAPLEVLVKLSQDKDENVRKNVLQHPNYLKSLTNGMLEILTKDSNYIVVKIAKRILEERNSIS